MKVFRGQYKTKQAFPNVEEARASAETLTKWADNHNVLVDVSIADPPNTPNLYIQIEFRSETAALQKGLAAETKREIRRLFGAIDLLFEAS